MTYEQWVSIGLDDRRSVYRERPTAYFYVNDRFIKHLYNDLHHRHLNITVGEFPTHEHALTAFIAMRLINT